MRAATSTLRPRAFERATMIGLMVERVRKTGVGSVPFTMTVAEQKAAERAMAHHAGLSALLVHQDQYPRAL